MAGTFDRFTETSREEDYRDYEERNLGEGWPYPDDDIVMPKRNEAYGAAPAGLEGENVGAEIADAAAIGSGDPALSRGLARGAIDDDALEEAIHEQLSAHGDIDENQITVIVRDGVAKLTGTVETSAMAAIAAQLAAAVPGVRAVYNLVVLSGLDGHIPADAGN